MAEGDNGGGVKPLAVVMDTQDDIPASYRELYAEKSGKWVLTGITGIKTQADIDNLNKSLSAERDAHKRTKDRLRPFVEYNEDQIKEIQSKLDQWDELVAKAEAGGKPDDEKINQLVESRIKTRIAPVEREKTQLAEQIKALSEQVTRYQQAEARRVIHDEVRKARVASKAREDAEEDILLNAERVFEITDDGRVVTRDGVGVTPGIGPDIWFQEMQPKRSYWWPESSGGGAKGGKAGAGGGISNPWKAESFNLTEQGRIVRESPERAKQMMAAAGVAPLG